jgi:antitoxin HicB
MDQTIARPKTTMTNATEILKRPYSWVVVPEEDGSFRAEILEFPGCFALGQTRAEALTALEDVAVSWLEGTLEKGLAVPSPVEAEQFSGKFVLRLPKSLHRRASHAARRDGVSLNQFIVATLAIEVGAEERKGSTVTVPSALYLTNNVMNFSWRGDQTFSLIGTLGLSHLAAGQAVLIQTPERESAHG